MLAVSESRQRAHVSKVTDRMARRIVIIDGHPDRSEDHLCHALADAYAKGASSAGHTVQRVEIARIDFPLLRSKEQYDQGSLPDPLQPAQDAIGAADHLVIIYPLWLGSMPALLKAFLEQVFRPSFAYDLDPRKGTWTKRLKGKSARIVVTMGMPVLAYRWIFGAHSLKSLERNILGFVGIAPIKESLYGMVEVASAETRQKWLAEMERLGRSGA
jgi:putative NADPH-quinone reductase